MTLLPTFMKKVFNPISQHLYLPRKISGLMADLGVSEITLRNPRGYTWTVKLEFIGHDNSECRLCDDWKKFMADNYVKEEYTVFFINNEPFVFDVVVLDSKGITSTMFWGVNEEELHDEPNFDVMINKTAIQKGRIAIPKAFWSEHIVSSGRSHEQKATIIGKEDRRWVVDVVEHADGRHFLSNGTKEMIKDLKLQVNAVGNMKLQNVPSLLFVFWV